MAKKFRTPDGTEIECERKTKTLKLVSILNTDYYKGKNHDAFTFVDEENNQYVYDATLNADMTEYNSKFAKELAFKEGKYIKLTGYFLPPSSYLDKIYIYSPRLLSIEDSM